MKIAIDVSQMCYQGTGVARYVFGLTQALLALNTKHKFVLFAGALRQRSFFTSLKKTDKWNQATWKILPLPPKIAGIALNTLPIKIENLIGPVDLFHSNDWAEPSSSCPRVTTVHDLVFHKYPSTVDALILDTQTKRLAKVVTSGTHVIADSKSTKNDLMEIYGLPSTRIDVIYPGLDATYFVQKQEEIVRVKNKYNLPEKYILSLGTQEPRKNIPLLIKACASLDLPLILTGKYGWGKEKSYSTANVVSTGYVDEADLPGLYSGASVFVYPSLYEGFGFPVLEAMACGCPVVVSNVSSLPEVVGKAGVLVDPHDADSISQGIKQALASRTQLIKLGLSQAQKFSWDKTTNQVLEVYEKITNRN
jgi:glycosyltransferase involved in cell wall biosynthesis